MCHNIQQLQHYLLWSPGV